MFGLVERLASRGVRVVALVMTALILPAVPAWSRPPPVESAQAHGGQLDALVKRLNDLGIRNGNQPFTLDNATRATTLNIDARAWQHLTDEDLAAFLLLPRLANIDIGRGKITAAGIAQLARLPELTSLGLYGLAIDDKLLEALATSPKLAVLNLGSTRGWTDSGMAHIASIRNLRSLTLDRAEITDAGLAALASSKTLETLSLQQMPNVTDEGLKHVAALSNLRTLGLNFTRINTGLSYLAASRTLQQLSLMNTAVDDRGAMHLAGLSSLRRLFIWGTAITDDSMKAIGGLENLDTLYLNRTKVTDKGLEALSHLKHLKILWLSETAVGDAGMAALVDLPLSRITIEDTQDGDAGLTALSRIPTLIAISVRKARITEAGVDAARKASPKLRITR